MGWGGEARAIGAAGTNPAASRLKFGSVRRDSLPPCGGGMGWGVVRWGTAVPHLPTPTPIPSPQGGGEEYAASANRISTPLPGFASLNPDYGEETRPC